MSPKARDWLSTVAVLLVLVVGGGWAFGWRTGVWALLVVAVGVFVKVVLASSTAERGAFDGLNTRVEDRRGASTAQIWLPAVAATLALLLGGGLLLGWRFAFRALIAIAVMALLARVLGRRR